MGYFVASDVILDRVGLRPEALTRLIQVVVDWQRALGRGGMQLAVYRKDILTLSLWTGRDEFSGEPIRRDTMFPLLSATKGLAALVLLHLHHRGHFDWHDPVSAHWPEFAANGKGSATIECVVSHRLGLPMLTADWRRWPDRNYMTRLVERARPAWEPGTRYGYHGGSWGIVVDELVRRWTGRETGQVLSTELAAPIRANQCHIGLPPDRYCDVARLAFLEPHQRRPDSPFAPFGPDREHNSLELLASCQSSSGGVASAEHLARLYNIAAQEGSRQGRMWWSKNDQRNATRPRNDPAVEAPAARAELRFAWGLGFMVSPSAPVFGTAALSTSTIGHPGASGAIGYADPRHRLAVAFTINGVGGRQMYARYQLIGDLLRSALSFWPSP